MNLGSRLEGILKERGMTVTQLGREAGVPAQTLYAMIRRDSNKVDMGIMAKILMALDMDLLEFVELETPGHVSGRAAGPSERSSGGAGRQKEPAAKEPAAKEQTRRREMETYLL